MNKFYHYFIKRDDYTLYYWGWDRHKRNDYGSDPNVHYFFKGIHLNLPFSYGLYIIVLFFKLLFKNVKKFDNVVCVNFESALPVYWASKIKGFSYIYEIYDEFSKSYNFPCWIKTRLRNKDIRIINKADYVIHVDANRLIGPEKDKAIVIENTPNDHWNGAKRDYEQLEHRFAIIGFFSDARGMEQIYKFARENTSISFLLAGRFTNSSMKVLFEGLENVECHDFMPQEQLFSMMESCCGIFSLYNPNLEINRYAASNKVYDAMMMGIPVITNKEVLNSAYIESVGCGLVVEYEYGESWKPLSESSFVELAKQFGSKGRALYLNEFRFDSLVSKRLLPILK